MRDHQNISPISDCGWMELRLENPEWPPRGGRTKVLLIALNVPGYYSLPVRILALLGNRGGNGERFDVRFVEASRDNAPAPLVDAVAAWQPRIVAFSLNIWNRDECIVMARQIRERLPDIVILGGGQEVTHSVYDFLTLAPEYDYLIDGEGEIPFSQFLEGWDHFSGKLKDPVRVSGLHYRERNETSYSGPAQVVDSLDEIPSPILAGLVNAGQKMKLGVMLEGSRGCPFRCGFCFEGAKRSRIRTASLERLQQECDYMAARGAHYFHLMDAILCHGDLQRLRGLSEFFARLKKKFPKTVTSVEVYADQVTEEIARCMGSFSVLDLGLQTTNPETAKAIHRPFSPEKFRRGISFLRNTGATCNIYLICGLPHETVTTFLQGLRFALDEKPTRLFINELCLLNGTELRWRAGEYGYEYDSAPPYLVHSSAWMSRREMSVIRVMSKEIEKRHNLCARSVHSSAPWLGRRTNFEGGSCYLSVCCECSGSCSGCLNAQWRGPARIDGNINELLRDAADKDMVVSGGDGLASGGALMQLAGQFQLAGTARNKLVGPPGLFASFDLVERLINRGIWHFKTFIYARPEDNISRLGDADILSPAMQNLGGSFQLRGLSSIRPHVEVVLLPGAASPLEYRAAVQSLTCRQGIVVTVPEEVQEWGEEWQKCLGEAFEEAIDNKCWVKLPPASAGGAWASLSPQSGPEVIEQLNSFQMVSREPNRPPCFRAEGCRPESVE